MSLNKVAFIDLDGTLIEGFSQEHLLKFFLKKGLISATNFIKIIFFISLYKIAILKDVGKLYEIGLVCFRDRDKSYLDDIVEEFVSGNSYRLLPSGKHTLDKLKSDGYQIVLLSAATDIVVEKFARLFGADDYICTRLRYVNGKFSGSIDGIPVYGSVKLDYLKKYIYEHNVNRLDCVAYADHESDLDVLNYVGHGYIYNRRLEIFDEVK